MTSPFRFLAPEWHDSLPSTNTFLRERQRAARDPGGTVVAALTQTAGRGRMGNVWVSPAGADLTFSFLWRGRVPLAEAGTFSLVCGLALADYLQDLGLSPLCKWPNDLLVDDGKICGILCESASPPDGSLELVVGMGLNLADDPARNAAAGNRAASLEKALGARPAPDATLSAFLPRIARRINEWQESGFAGLHAEYAAMLWGRGERVRVRTGRETLWGVIDGVGRDGRLLLADDAGKILEISSAVAIEPEEGE